MDFKRHVREHLPPLTIAREPEIVDELAQHLADLYREAIAAGATHETAVARALEALPTDSAGLAHDIESASRALPGLIVNKWRTAEPEASRSAGQFTAVFGDLRQDLRYAVRMFATAPAFTLIVFLTLALGVGANAVIFSAVDAILLRTPGITDPGTLVSVYNASTDGRDRFSTLSFPDYADVRDSGIFQGAAAFGSIYLALDIGGQTEAIEGELVTGNFFDVLGTRVIQGRSFVADEDRRGTPVHVAVVSYRFWQRRMAGNHAAVGRQIVLNGSAYTVIGVAPALFAGALVGRAPDVWVPMALQAEVRPPSAGLRRTIKTTDLLGQRGPRWLSIVARGRQGSDIPQSMARLDVLAKRLQAAYPQTNAPRAFNVVPLGEGPGVRASARPVLLLLIASVALVLLIACANVASLLLARSVARRREIAVRMAVGAGSGRLARQCLTESVLLSCLGALGGVLIAKWGTRLLYVAGLPETIPLGVNGHVLLFTLGVAVASGVIFGTAPILQTLRADTISALRDEGGAVATGVRAARLRRAFVVFQIAVSLVLLIGAGLFLRTLQKAYAIDLGYQIQSTMVADINLDVRGYTQEAGLVAYRQILDRLNAIPGVASAGAARVVVLSGGARTVSVSSDGQPLRPDGSNNLDVRVNVVSDGYLQALGIPLLRGRDFNRTDDANAPRVAIMSQSLASKMWPDQDPIGKVLGNGTSPGATVIGVVPHTVYRNALEREAPPFYYVALAQNYEAGMSFHVRATQSDPLALLTAVRGAVRDVDPRIVVGRAGRLQEVFDESIAEQRVMATLVGVFGAVALLLASVGVYGIMAHLAGQRRTEIGIRVALGARPSSIFALILGEGLRLVAIGAVLGLTGALAATRLIANHLFGVRPADPLTFAVVCSILAIVGTLACLIPARRAMRVDPVVALRSA
jgi:putative ABC transport system permease protein